MSSQEHIEMATKDYEPIIGKDPTPGSYPIHGEESQEEAEGCGTSCCTIVMVIVSVFLVIIFFPFSLIFMIKVIPEYERAVIFRLGRLSNREAQGPGTMFILPCIDKYITVDLRTKSFDVPPQNILTKDSVTIHVDAVVYYKIYDPVISITNIINVGVGTRLLAQTQLRNVMGAHSLADAMTSRELMATQLKTHLDSATDPWGVKVERVEIKDVRLPKNLQRAMAAEAEASREARAKVIAAQGEMNAARSLKEAAEVINRSPTALQLRYLQTLNFIAAERGSTIIFPIPMDIMGGMEQSWVGGLGQQSAGLGQSAPLEEPEEPEV